MRKTCGLGKAFWVCGLSLACSISSAFAQESPVESKTWYLGALDRLAEVDDTLSAPGARLQISDALLASMIYDTFQTEEMAAAVEQLSKLTISTPTSLPNESPQRGIYSFVELGHLQVAYAKPFAVMSAQAADDLFRKANSPLGEAAWTQRTLAHLWIRLGEVDKALAILDEKSSLFIEQRIDLMRQAYASAKIDAARHLADTMPAAIKKASSDIESLEAAHLASFVDALIDCKEPDRAREVMKQIPAAEATLKAYKALLRHDQVYADDEALAKDIEAMFVMLTKMSDYDSDQTSACIAAAEICAKLRRDADAVKCLDRLDELAAQPDPPLTMPMDWANAARVSLYTTANDRADGYLARAQAAMKGWKEAKPEDQLLLDVATARVYGVRSNGAEFERRLADLNPRMKESNSFMASLAMRETLVELAGVSRDEKVVASLKQIVDRNPPGMGQVSLAMTRRYCRTGNIPLAWTIAQSISDRQWRLHAMAEVTHARLKTHDPEEQRQALLDVRTLPNPREAAYVMFFVGALLNGDDGFVGDSWMRWRD